MKKRVNKSKRSLFLMASFIVAMSLGILVFSLTQQAYMVDNQEGSQSTFNLLAQPTDDPSDLSHDIFLPYVTNISEDEPNIDQTEEWLNYTDENLGFAIQYPQSWHKLDISGLRYSKIQCFGATQGSFVMNFPQVCVEINPLVKPINGQGFFSNKPSDQKAFFDSLMKTQASAKSAGDDNETEIGGQLLAGLPAFEVIESAQVEGTEPSYVVNIFIEDPQKGLIRVSLHAWNRTEFENHEEVMRRIAYSVSF